MTRFVLSVLSVLFLTLPQPAQQVVPARDEALWGTVEQWLAAGSPAARRGPTEALEARLAPDTRAATIQQLFLFSAAGEDTRHGMAFGVLRQTLALADGDVVDALVPLLDADDPALRQALARTLAAFEDPSVERGPDFSVYRPRLEARRARGQEYERGLVRHLFTVDAHRAFQLLLALEPRTPETFEGLRALLLAEHRVEDARWRLAFRFDTAGTLEAAPFDALRALAASPRACARLYAARVLVLEPALRAAVPVETLLDDADPIVRELAAERRALEEPR